MLMNGQQRRAWRQASAAPSDFGFDEAILGSFFSGALLSVFALSDFFVESPSPVFASALGASSFAARLRFLSPSFLKSVSYQPLPARRNAGAVRRRLTRVAPHFGQVDGSGSASFCRRSNVSP